jgi:hypothetical protein
LVDVFLPDNCKRKFVSSLVGKVPSSNTGCFCNHDRRCKVCLTLKEELNSSSVEKIDIAKQVKASGKFNFEGCRIQVNHKIDTDFMSKMLHGYFDMQVCDILKFGFPIDIDLEDKSILLSEASKVKNHIGAVLFPDDMVKYLQKEASYGAIIGPFDSCPFVEGMVISPLKTVHKSNSNKRRVILDLSYPKNGNGVNDSVPKDHYLGNKVELVFPKIDDFVALIKSKGQGFLCINWI